MKDSFERKHPIYWFEDGSFVLDVEQYQFKVHRTLVARHSRFLSGLSHQENAPPITNGEQSSATKLSAREHHIILDNLKQVQAKDVEVLLQHLYHDVYVLVSWTYYPGFNPSKLSE